MWVNRTMMNYCQVPVVHSLISLALSRTIKVDNHIEKAAYLVQLQYDRTAPWNLYDGQSIIVNKDLLPSAHILH